MIKLFNLKKNDILLLIFILTVSLISFLAFVFTLKDGNYVSVKHNGKEILTLSLENDKVETITLGDNKEYKNELVIENGYAYIKTANCPDKICVSHRKISNVGETIVCLPHKLVISIVEKPN